jgi:nucleotide-binding universal stress UspA family protein
VPVLVTASQAGGVSRILVAADYSESAPLAIRQGERFARLFDAHLRVLHVVELLPTGPEYEAGMPQDEFYEVSREICQESLWPHIESQDVERVVRQGHIAEAIRTEVEEWGADLLVVGTHGHTLASRLMMGSTSEALLNDLPTSMLFVPRERSAE